METVNSNEFVNKLIDIANKYNTLYIMGCIGAPIENKTYQRYIDAYSYNQKPERQQLIKSAIGTDCFGFDCVCLIKSVLWGWNGDVSHEYGGAVYKSNQVDDLSTSGMLKICTNISDDFSNIEIGEYLWTEGHCGIYIGDGLAVECTPKWENKVQITAVSNIKASQEYNQRKWEKHGKLPYIDYSPNHDNTHFDETNKNASSNSSDNTDKNDKTNDSSISSEKRGILKKLIECIIEFLKRIYDNL